MLLSRDDFVGRARDPALSHRLVAISLRLVRLRTAQSLEFGDVVDTDRKQCWQSEQAFGAG